MSTDSLDLITLLTSLAGGWNKVPAGFIQGGPLATVAETLAGSVPDVMRIH